ncbi:MAG: acyl-ACP--UDP-N-acetylglucosamine O-acyltransferase [bacterium]|nr:acyl-ACP--UDP-N-acetylglucosamine O-acyltransferase [bacterium]
MNSIDVNDIKSILPHRYPFLLIDKVIEVEDKKRIVAIKNVTINEPFFQGHFPQQPIMPGVLTLEAMAQAGGVLFLKDPEYNGRMPFFAAIEKAKFRKPVIPGDQLRFEVETTKIKGPFIKMNGKALVNGKVVSEADLVFTLTERPSKRQIDPTASVHSSAILGKDVVVGPYTIIGKNVTIGDRTILEAHIMVEKYTRIGSDCHIHFGSVLGSDAQDIKYNGEKTWVVIGDRNEIREYVTINRSTGKNTVTEIGSDNILMTNVHIGHNSKLGNNITIANMANMAGHTIVEDNAVIGGMTGIHQFTRIGKGSMVGAYTRLPQDVPPFMLCEGNPATIRGFNLVGLKRKGVSSKAIKEIKNIYKQLYRLGKNKSQAIEEILKMQDIEPETQHLVNFIQADSNRGLTKKSIDTVEVTEE